MPKQTLTTIRLVHPLDSLEDSIKTRLTISMGDRCVTLSGWPSPDTQTLIPWSNIISIEYREVWRPTSSSGPASSPAGPDVSSRWPAG